MRTTPLRLGAGTALAVLVGFGPVGVAAATGDDMPGMTHHHPAPPSPAPASPAPAHSHDMAGMSDDEMSGHTGHDMPGMSDDEMSGAGHHGGAEVAGNGLDPAGHRAVLAGFGVLNAGVLIVAALLRRRRPAPTRPERAARPGARRPVPASGRPA